MVSANRVANQKTPSPNCNTYKLLNLVRNGGVIENFSLPNVHLESELESEFLFCIAVKEGAARFPI